MPLKPDQHATHLGRTQFLESGVDGIRPRSLLTALSLLGGSLLIAVGWWDHWNPDQISRWWAGERIYPFYWNRLALTLAVVLPLALLVWWVRPKLSGLSEAASQARGLPPRTRGGAGVERKPRRAGWRCIAWGWAAGFAVPFLLWLKYRVTWLDINYGSSIWTYGFILVLSIAITWLIWPALRNQRLLNWLSRQGPVIVPAAMLAYALVYGGLSIARHASFGTHALDLGTMDQAVWNTSRGRLLEYTPLPVDFGDAAPDLSPDSRLVGGKLELILLLLSPLYWLWADPRLLIGLQALLLAAGAIPLYALAWSHFKDGSAAVFISLAYLLYLPLHYVTLAEFHTSALMVPFLLWAWLAAERGRWRNYYLATGLALFCRVDAALVLLGMGLGLFLGGVRSGADREAWRRHGAATMLVGMGWLILGFGLVSPWAKGVYGSGTNELLPERYGGFGQDVPGIAWGLLTQPLTAIRALFDREKLQTLVDLAAGLGAMPLLAPLALLPALPVLVLNLLSASPYQNSILAHYFAPVIPFLFIATVRGASSAGRWISSWLAKRGGPGLSPVEGGRVAAFFTLVTTSLVVLFLSPFPPGWRFHLADYYQVSNHESALARTLELIPSEAVVSAQSSLFPHLSRRPVIYLYPTLADAEYVALDLNYSTDKAPIDEHVFYPTLEGLLADPAFQVAAFNDGALLLRRGPGQPPPGFTQDLANYNAGLYRSAVVEYRGPTRLWADDLVETLVVVENRGTQSWKTVGPYPIFLGYHWWAANGDLVEWNGARTSLEHGIKPGEAAALQVRLITPREPGDYVLEWDLVHDRRAWFSDRGGITLRLDVSVE